MISPSISYSLFVLSPFPVLILLHTPSLSFFSLSISFSSSTSLFLSLRRVMSLPISYLLPVPFCSFRFNISTPSLHSDILHSLHLLAASMSISLVSTPYIYLFLIWISLSFSPCMPICLYLLSPSLSGLSSHKGGCRGRDEPERVNCLFLTAQQLQ